MIRSGGVRYFDCLEADFVDIDSVRQHPENPNNGDVEEIMESIEVNGMYRPIEIQASTGYIVAGNTTWEACKMLQAKVIPVKALPIDDDHARRIVLIDNKSAEHARRDPALEKEMLDKLVGTAEDPEEIRRALLGTGYTERELERFREVEEAPLDLSSPKNSWVTLSIFVPPAFVKAFRELTHEGDNDVDRFEVLLRRAGWDGE